jgi:general secretion pathway protein G
MTKNKSGFTLIELLVVIAIIGLLSTLSVLALNAARARARDAKRISDVQQIQTALEMYYNDMNDYPASATVGGAITANGNTYMKIIPTPPLPIDGSLCPAANAYTYTYTSGTGGGTSTYSIKYCLGASINGVPGNAVQTATQAGIQ